MKCTEVGELMQRHLDYDLNETELEVLMTHLSNCNQCTELFEKLTLLSGSLEQLPRVTPSISIVDAIFPELDKIESAKEKEKKLLQLKRKRIWTTVSSIATAAAIMLLMVNLSGNSLTSSNDIAMPNAANKKSVDSGAPRSADEDSPLVIEEREGLGLNPDESLIKQFAVVPTSSTRDIDSVDNNVDASYQDTHSIPSTHNTHNSDEVTPITEGPIPYEDDSDSQSLVDENLPMQPFKNIAEAGEEDLGQQANSTSYSYDVAQQQYFSLDNLFYLQFETNTIAVYETSTKEIVQEWKKPVEGVYQFLSWDKDGTGFTFQVTDVDGKVNSFSWEIGQEEVK